MKVFKKIIHAATTLVMIFILTGCDRKVTIESTVHPDGTLDRNIVLTEVDSSELNHNMFGIQSSNGWKVQVKPYIERPDDRVEKKDTSTKYVITFGKHFSSVAQANVEFDKAGDSLFRIRSAFNRKFRWFYTYLEFSDTYRAINRFHQVKMEDFFTKEDFDFIARMPAEGKAITKADSVYLDHLNKKIFDHFAMQAIYEEHFNLMLSVMRKAGIDKKYVDVYLKQKGYMFSILTKKENDNVFSEDAFMHQVMDSLNVDFPMDKITGDYRRSTKEIKTRIDFMSEAGFATKYTHIIKMPWDVIETNADSVKGNTLFFQPSPIKFMLKDYTMYATSRDLNYWAVLLSGLLIGVTIVAFVKKRS
jgi:hypothetical protein